MADASMWRLPHTSSPCSDAARRLQLCECVLKGPGCHAPGECPQTSPAPPGDSERVQSASLHCAATSCTRRVARQAAPLPSTAGAPLAILGMASCRRSRSLSRTPPVGLPSGFAAVSRLDGRLLPWAADLAVAIQPLRIARVPGWPACRSPRQFHRWPWQWSLAHSAVLVRSHLQGTDTLDRGPTSESRMPVFHGS